MPLRDPLGTLKTRALRDVACSTDDAVASQLSPPGWDGTSRMPSRTAVGSTWIWEPMLLHARDYVTVAAIRWDGDEWWVQTQSEAGMYWNDLSRFWEACWPNP